MITRNLNLTITDKSASLDKSIVLYRYDRGVTFNFKLISNEYTFNENEITKARTIIKRPNKDITVSEIDDILDGIYTFHLDDSYTNDTFEIGIYTMQLQLYSNSDECITIAPFTFEVKDLIGIPAEDAALVGYSTVGYSSTKGSETLDTGDLENGEYLKTVWVDKDLITSGKLNKIENVLDYLVEDAANNEGGSVDGPITDLEVTNSVSMGRIGDVGANSVALGTNCQAGDNTSAIGYGLIANAAVAKRGQCVVGRYNEENTSAIFVVGSGVGDSTRRNAFVVEGNRIIMNNEVIFNTAAQINNITASQIMMPNHSGEGDIDLILIDKNGILIRPKDVIQDEHGNPIKYHEDYYVATKEYVKDAVANIEVPEADLTGYATESYVDDAIGDINAILDALNGEII